MELMQLAQRQNRTKFRDRVLKPLLRKEFIELTIPDRPRSPEQRYRLTNKGRQELARLRD
jgi:DNA-binding PadR family transcriptional regulator